MPLPTTQIRRAVRAKLLTTPGLPPAARLDLDQNRNFVAPEGQGWLRLTIGYATSALDGYRTVEDRPQLMIDLFAPLNSGVADMEQLRDQLLDTFRIGATIPVPGEPFHLRCMNQDPGTWRDSAPWSQLPVMIDLRSHRDR